MEDQANSSTKLRERIADYRRLRRMTMDKRVLRAIDTIIAEAQQELERLENSTGHRA